MYSGPGYVKVYHLENNGLTSSWTQLGQDIIGEANGDEFGCFVSLSDDGKTLGMGAPNAYMPMKRMVEVRAA